jgi:hypothetical protein
MQDNNSSDKPKEPNKTICNRCMSEMTGIHEQPINPDDNIVDLATVINHMEFSLDASAVAVQDDEPSTAMIYHTYLHNDIEMLKSILGIVDGECTCGENHEEEEEEEE